MKWNRYVVTADNGARYEAIVGEWLKPGRYPFGVVTFVEELSDEESKEYFDIEQGIYDMWYETVMSEVLE